MRWLVVEIFRKSILVGCDVGFVQSFQYSSVGEGVVGIIQYTVNYPGIEGWGVLVVDVVEVGGWYIGS